MACYSSTALKAPHLIPKDPGGEEVLWRGHVLVLAACRRCLEAIRAPCLATPLPRACRSSASPPGLHSFGRPGPARSSRSPRRPAGTSHHTERPRCAQSQATVLRRQGPEPLEGQPAPHLRGGVQRHQGRAVLSGGLENGRVPQPRRHTCRGRGHRSKGHTQRVDHSVAS